MADNREFIINLVSNASMDVYCINKIASFTTQLPGNGIDLSNSSSSSSSSLLSNDKGGFWEVALLEISFPSKFKNIVEGRFRYTSPTLGDAIGNTVELFVKPGLYTSVSDILDDIYRQLEPIVSADGGTTSLKKALFWYEIDEITHSVSIKMVNKGTQLSLLSSDLRSILGFSLDTGMHGIVHKNNDDDGWIKAEYSMDIRRLHNMMVYSEIIEHQVIGDVLAPLLRSIPLVSKMKGAETSNTDVSQVTKTFAIPLQFKKVLLKSFHSIRIELYAENGELVPFLDIGRTALTLIFRYNTPHH